MRMRALLAFRGRTGRLPFALVMATVSVLAYSTQLRRLVDMAIHSVDPAYPLENIPLARDAPILSSGVATAILLLAAALAIAFIWASLAALARRFHDIDLSAWLVLPASVLPALVPNVIETDYLPPFGYVLLIAVMALVPGTPGPNRFDAAATCGDQPPSRDASARAAAATSDQVSSKPESGP